MQALRDDAAQQLASPNAWRPEPSIMGYRCVLAPRRPPRCVVAHAFLWTTCKPHTVSGLSAPSRLLFLHVRYMMTSFLVLIDERSRPAQRPRTASPKPPPRQSSNAGRAKHMVTSWGTACHTRRACRHIHGCVSSPHLSLAPPSRVPFLG